MLLTYAQVPGRPNKQMRHLHLQNPQMRNAENRVRSLQAPSPSLLSPRRACLPQHPHPQLIPQQACLQQATPMTCTKAPCPHPRYVSISLGVCWACSLDPPRNRVNLCSLPFISTLFNYGCIVHGTPMQAVRLRIHPTPPSLDFLPPDTDTPRPRRQRAGLGRTGGQAKEA